MEINKRASKGTPRSPSNACYADYVLWKVIGVSQGDAYRDDILVGSMVY